MVPDAVLYLVTLALPDLRFHGLYGFLRGILRKIPNKRIQFLLEFIFRFPVLLLKLLCDLIRRPAGLVPFLHLLHALLFQHVLIDLEIIDALVYDTVGLGIQPRGKALPVGRLHVGAVTAFCRIQYGADDGILEVFPKAFCHGLLVISPHDGGTYDVPGIVGVIVNLVAEQLR